MFIREHSIRGSQTASILNLHIDNLVKLRENGNGPSTKNWTGLIVKKTTRIMKKLDNIVF